MRLARSVRTLAQKDRPRLAQGELTGYARTRALQETPLVITPSKPVASALPGGEMITPGFGIRCETRQFEPGKSEIAPLSYSVLFMNIGGPIRVTCRRDGQTYQGTELHGDFDLMPAGMGSAWETFGSYRSFILRLRPNVLSSVAQSAELDPERLRLSSLLGFRDPQLEHLVRAFKSEVEAGSPGGRPFADALGTALVVRLAHLSDAPVSPPAPAAKRLRRIDARRVQRVLHYIEENLEGELGLADIAAAGGLSVSNLKHVFRRATGQPVYQYVIHRRVALAERLLRDSAMPISEVALAAGFSHHSHLTRHLRRWRGTTPSLIRNNGG